MLLYYAYVMRSVIVSAPYPPFSLPCFEGTAVFLLQKASAPLHLPAAATEKKRESERDKEKKKNDHF